MNLTYIYTVASVTSIMHIIYNDHINIDSQAITILINVHIHVPVSLFNNVDAS